MKTIRELYDRLSKDELLFLIYTLLAHCSTLTDGYIFPASR
jgi:hypothetical protein